MLKKCEPNFWNSLKYKEAISFVLETGLIAFADGFKMVYYLKPNMNLIIWNHVPLDIKTNSLSLFRVLTKTAGATDKKQKIDFQPFENG